MFYSHIGDFHFHRDDHPGGTVMEGMTFHDAYEMYILLSGRKLYRILSETVDLKAPAILLICPAVLLRAWSPDSAPHRMAVANFSAEMMARFSDCMEQTILSTQARALLFSPEASFCEKLADDLAYIYREEDSLTLPRMTARIFEAICVLSRSEPTKQIFSDRTIENEERIVVKILLFIQKNLDGTLSNQEVATRYGYTVEGLTRLLKKYTGMTYMQHIQQFRMTRAGYLLVHTDKRMEEIAEECGYSGANYFGDCVRRTFGVSPSEIRRAGRSLPHMFHDENELFYSLKKIFFPDFVGEE